jgi:hypothetical protein
MQDHFKFCHNADGIHTHCNQLQQVADGCHLKACYSSWFTLEIQAERFFFKHKQLPE